MPIKKRQSVSDRAEALANQLADRRYGDAPNADDDELVITSISISKSLLHRAEDLATKNKRANVEPKSVSGLIRKALEKFIS